MRNFLQEVVDSSSSGVAKAIALQALKSKKYKNGLEKLTSLKNLPGISKKASSLLDPQDKSPKQKSEVPAEVKQEVPAEVKQEDSEKEVADLLPDLTEESELSLMEKVFGGKGKKGKK